MKTIQYIDKDTFLPKDEWGKLSLQDRASIIEAGVRNGMNSLSDIKAAYNSFAEGGQTSKKKFSSLRDITKDWESDYPIKDVTDIMKQGPYYLYESQFDGIPVEADGRYYVVPEYYNLDDVDENSYRILDYKKEFRPLLPKRDYIGGDNYRERVVDLIPGLADSVYSKAKAYGADPNVMMRRLIKEGFLDNRAREYNELVNTPDQKDYWNHDNIWNREYNSAGEFGLDWVSKNIQDGLYELRNPEDTWMSAEGVNEKNQTVYPIVANLNTSLEALASDAAWRQGRIEKTKNPPKNELPFYVNASYNLDTEHKDLDNRPYILKTYSFDPYYDAQGKFIHRKDFGGPIVEAANKFWRGGKRNKEAQPIWDAETQSFMLPDVDVAPAKEPGWFMKMLMHGAQSNPELSGSGQWFNTATGYKTDDNGIIYQDANTWKEDAPEARLRNNLAVVGAAGALGTVGSAAFEYPEIMKTIDVAGSIDGLRNAASKNGIQKTIRLAKDGNTKGAMLSGLGDAFDIFGTVGLVKTAREALLARKNFARELAGINPTGGDLRNIVNTDLPLDPVSPPPALARAQAEADARIDNIFNYDFDAEGHAYRRVPASTDNVSNRPHDYSDYSPVLSPEEMDIEPTLEDLVARGQITVDDTPLELPQNWREEFERTIRDITPPSFTLPVLGDASPFLGRPTKIERISYPIRTVMEELKGQSLSDLYKNAKFAVKKDWAFRKAGIKRSDPAKNLGIDLKSGKVREIFDSKEQEKLRQIGRKPGDKEHASYFNMSPEEVSKKLARDFENIPHGGRAALIGHSDLSTDSYPLFMTHSIWKSGKVGEMVPVTTSEGQQAFQVLNTLGHRTIKGKRMTTEDLLNRVNKPIDMYNSKFNASVPHAIITKSGNIAVPSFFFNKWKYGGPLIDLANLYYMYN